MICINIFSISSVTVLIAFGVIIVTSDSILNRHDGYGVANDKLNELLKHIDNAVYFYERNYLNMTIDGLTGLKCLEGEINFVTNGDLYINGKSLSLPSDIDQRLYSLQTRSQTVINKAKTNFAEKNDAYIKKMNFIIDNQWRPSVYFRMVKSHFNWNITILHDSLKETDSDDCLRELHDVSTSDSNTNSCQISNKCLNQMLLATNTCCYSLTHQLLYSIFASMFSCHSEINQELKKYSNSLFGLQQTFCSNIWREMQSLHNKQEGGDIPDRYRDLYMQQFVLCATIGFVEFYNETMLASIYQWQDQNTGCFQQGDEFRRDNKAHNSGNRQLKMESELEGKCLTHRTAMGLCALSQYLRLFLDTRPSTFLPGLPTYIIDIINERQAYQKRALPRLLQDNIQDTAPLGNDDQRMFFLKDHFKKLHDDVKINQLNSMDDSKFNYIDSFLDPDLDKIRQDIVNRRQREREIASKKAGSSLFGNYWFLFILAVIVACFCYLSFCRYRKTRSVILSGFSGLHAQYHDSIFFSK